jgi:SAM-dependent methyltransferase
MGSAERQGDLWSANPAGWAEEAEAKQRPLFEAVLERLDPPPGTALLDAGCGSGLFAELAAERGVRVNGLDAAPGLIAYAGRRVPAGQFTVGELEALPYPDGAFDAVTAFNSVFYAANPRRVIAEMARVTGPGGHVVVTVGAGPLKSDLPKLVDVLRPLLAPAKPDDEAQIPVTLSDIDQMRAELEAVGLELLDQVEVPFAWIYDDMDRALYGQTSSGPAEAAIRHSGREAVVEALHGFFSDRTQPDGTIRMDVAFRYALARQPG